MQIFNAKKTNIQFTSFHEQLIWARDWIIASCSVDPLQVFIANLTFC